MVISQARAEHICEELKSSCEETINQADNVIKRQQELIQYLDKTNNDLLSQVGSQQKEILALQDPPWYSRPITIFLIGIITGGVLNEKVNRN